MELYKKFIKETCNRELVYDDNMFYTYIVNGKEIYLENVYICEENRSKGFLDSILKNVEKIGKDLGCNIMTTSTCLNYNDEIITRTISICSRKGFKIESSDKNMIYFSKEI